MPTITFEEFDFLIFDSEHNIKNLSEDAPLLIEIVDYGIGEEETVPIQISILDSSDAPIQIELTDLLAPLTNPLAVPLGDGSLLLTWDEPSVQHDYTAVYISFSLSGTYSRLMYVFGRRGGLIRNVPPGITFYLRVSSIGFNGDESTLTQVERGKISSGNITCEIRAINGSVIPAGAVFSVLDNDTGTLVSLRANSEIIITDALSVSVESFDFENDIEELLTDNDIVVDLDVEDFDIVEQGIII